MPDLGTPVELFSFRVLVLNLSILPIFFAAMLLCILFELLITFQFFPAHHSKVEWIFIQNYHFFHHIFMCNLNLLEVVFCTQLLDPYELIFEFYSFCSYSLSSLVNIVGLYFFIIFAKHMRRVIRFGQLVNFWLLNLITIADYALYLYSLFRFIVLVLILIRTLFCFFLGIFVFFIQIPFDITVINEIWNTQFKLLNLIFDRSIHFHCFNSCKLNIYVGFENDALELNHF